MKPSIFLDLDIDAAIARAKAEGRLLLVSLTKTASHPGEDMDRYTWSDPRVVAWIDEQALAIQIDVDVDAANAAKVKAKWEPSAVAIKDGVEIDRYVGFQQAEKVLDWLDGLARGETLVAQLRRRLAANPKDVLVRMDLGIALSHLEHFDEALAEHVWLWTHMVEHMPQMQGLKHSFFVERLKHVFSVHPPARDTFAALRDASAPNLDALDANVFADWCALNEALGEPDKMVVWFDEHFERASAIPALATDIRKALEPLLIRAGRWSDVGRLYADPVADFREQVALSDRVRAELEMVAKVAPPGARDDGMALTRIAATETLRESAWKLVRALRAAGRDDEAKQIVDAAVAADDSAEMASALEGRYTAPTPHELLARTRG
jgi:hypothetical protein